MKSTFLLRSVVNKICLFTLLVALLPGCETTVPTNPGSGHIYIDHPQVFTRERLLNRRLKEQQWLEQQLDQPITSSIQGSIDTREFVGFAAALKGNFDPLGGAQSQAAINNVQNNSKISDLQNQLQVEVLKKQIDYVKGTNFVVPTGMPTNSAPLTTYPSTNLLTPANAVINFSVFNSSNLPTLPNPTNIVRAGNLPEGLTSIQALDDKLAYRNAVQSLLREQELDDTHDLDGMALYTLKFDVSVVPGQENEEFGEVLLSLGGGTNLTEDDFAPWMRALNNELLEEGMSAQRRWYMDYLSQDEVDRLLSFAARYIARNRNQAFNWVMEVNGNLSNSNTNGVNSLRNLIDSFVSKSDVGQLSAVVTNLENSSTENSTNSIIQKNKGHLRKIATDWSYLSGLIEDLASGKRSAAGARGIAEIVRQRYQDALATRRNEDVSSGFDESVTNHICDVLVNSEGISMGTNEFGTNFFYACYAVEATNAAKLFASEVQKLIAGEAKPYVLVVEPKEYAQNLSDVAARQRVLSLAASLSALIPSVGASVGVDLQYLHDSEQRFDTIKRQPLLVGFADGVTNFGWVVGPKFEIPRSSKKPVGWSHTAIQHSVQASVVVPGWWKDLTLTASNFWLDAQANGKSKNSVTNSFSVRLPRNYAAITRALLAQVEQSPDQPTIFPRWDLDIGRKHITLQEGEDETVLIRGRDLWRNPEVFVGSQQGKNVHILPDMGGLTAEFDNVRLPASSKPGPQFADLEVVTSGGDSVLRNGVKILPKQQEQITAFVTLSSKFLTNGGQLVFEIDAAHLPKNYGQLALSLGDNTVGQWKVSGITNLPTGGGLWTLTVPSVWLPPDVVSGNSKELLVDLKIGQTPNLNEKLQSVLVRGPVRIVFFLNPDTEKLKLTQPTTVAPATLPVVTFAGGASPNAALTLQIQTTPELFREAYPGFEKDLSDQNARLILIDEADKLAAGPFNLTGSLDRTLQATATFTRPSFPSGGSVEQTWALMVTNVVSASAENIRVTPQLKVKWQ